MDRITDRKYKFHEREAGRNSVLSVCSVSDWDDEKVSVMVAPQNEFT